MASPRDITHTFTGAGEVQHRLQGRYLRILSATDDVYVQLDGGSEVLRKSGQAINDPDGFAFIKLRSTVAQTVQIVVADTPQDDNAQTITATVSATIGAGDTLTSAPDFSVPATTTSQVLAGRADRLTAIIKNLNSNTDPVRVGDASVGASRGHELMPGESISLDSTSSISVYNPKASAQSVSLLEIRDV